MIEYRRLTQEDLGPHALDDFQRRQEVTHCWRKENGQWVVRPVAFVDDWDDATRAFVLKCFKNVLATGGCVAAALDGGAIKGILAVEGTTMGSRGQYRELSGFWVSQELRGRGIGRRLFEMAKDFAQEQGTEKLYISAHSAVESQAFYRAMGCVEAEEYSAEHVRREPCDCQLECAVAGNA